MSFRLLHESTRSTPRMIATRPEQNGSGRRVLGAVLVARTCDQFDGRFRRLAHPRGPEVEVAQVTAS
jgi:hypothetical protein